MPLRAVPEAGCARLFRQVLSCLPMPRALLIEDEALPRAALREQLALLWHELVLDEAPDGQQGLAQFEQHRPELVFLDIRLPVLDGLALARLLSGRAHLVFVTAYEQHALQAFEHGAVDYLLKPLQVERLAQTVQRLRERLRQAPPDLGAVLDRLARPPAAQPLRWLQVGEGEALRLLTVAEVLYFQSDSKYTQVVAQGGEAWIRTSLKDLLAQLDPQQFWQVHRGSVVNLSHVDWVERHGLGQMRIHLRDHPRTLAVSQSFQGKFRQM